MNTETITWNELSNPMPLIPLNGLILRSKETGRVFEGPCIHEIIEPLKDARKNYEWAIVRGSEYQDDSCDIGNAGQVLIGGKWTYPPKVEEGKLQFETQPIFYVDPDVLQMANSLCQGGYAAHTFESAPEGVAVELVDMAKLIVEKVRSSK